MNAIAPAVAAAAPVAIQGFPWTALFTLIGLLLNGGVAVALVRNWPKMKELVIKARRDDLDDMRDRISELEKKVEAANTHAQAADDRTHVVQMQMVSLNAAFQLVASELQRRDPDNQTLKQARDLVAMAATGDGGMEAGLVRLSRASGMRDEA